MIVNSRPELSKNPKEWSTMNVVTGFNGVEIDDEFEEEEVIEEEVLDDDVEEEEDNGEGFMLDLGKRDTRISALSCDLGEFDWDSYVEEEEAREDGNVGVKKAAAKSKRTSFRPSSRFVPTMLHIGEDQEIIESEEEEEEEEEEDNDIQGFMDKPSNRRAQIKGAQAWSTMNVATGGTSVISEDVSNFESVVTDGPRKHSRIDMTGLIIGGTLEVSEDEELIEEELIEEEDEEGNGDGFVLNLEKRETRISALSCDLGEFDWDAYVDEEEAKEAGNVAEKKAVVISKRTSSRPSTRFVPMLEINEDQEINEIEEEADEGLQGFMETSTNNRREMKGRQGWSTMNIGRGSGIILEDISKVQSIVVDQPSNSSHDEDMTGFVMGESFQPAIVPDDEDIVIEEVVEEEEDVEGDGFMLQFEKRDTRISTLSFDGGEFDWDGYVDEEEANEAERNKIGDNEDKDRPPILGIDLGNEGFIEFKSKDEESSLSRRRNRKLRDDDGLNDTDSVGTHKSKSKSKRKAAREKSKRTETDEASNDGDSVGRFGTQKSKRMSKRKIKKETSISSLNSDTSNDTDSVGTFGTHKSKRKDRRKLERNLEKQRSKKSVPNDASNDTDSVGTFGTHKSKQKNRRKLEKRSSKGTVADDASRDGDSVGTFGTHKTQRKDNRRRKTQREKSEIALSGDAASYDGKNRNHIFAGDASRDADSAGILGKFKLRRKDQRKLQSDKSASIMSDDASRDSDSVGTFGKQKTRKQEQRKSVLNTLNTGDADSVGTNGTSNSAGILGKFKLRRKDQKKLQSDKSASIMSDDASRDSDSVGTFGKQKTRKAEQRKSVLNTLDTGDADSVGTNGTSKSRKKIRRLSKKKAETGELKNSVTKDVDNGNNSVDTFASPKAKSLRKLRIRSAQHRRNSRIEKRKSDEREATAIFDVLLGS
jgi:hypothetical protein